VNPRLDDDQPIVAPAEKAIIDGQASVGGAGKGIAPAEIPRRNDLTVAIFPKALSGFVITGWKIAQPSGLLR
jgi:hypothetical protein